jgi:hypothetical protein
MTFLLKLTLPALAVLAPMETALGQTANGAEARLKERNITLPAAPGAVGNYVDAVRVGNLLYLSGNTSREWEPKGKLGKELTVPQGYQAARHAGLLFLAKVRWG